MKVILSIPGSLCPSGQDNDNLLGYLKDPDDQLWQPPPALLSSAEQMVGRDLGGPGRRLQQALQNAESGGSWSSPALEWGDLLQEPKRQALECP